MWLKILHSDWPATGPERWRQENPPPSPHPPPYSAVVVTVVSPIFLILHIPGRQPLLLAGTGRTWQIKMEETYTPTMMKPES
jgi:hypothetical protein